MDRQGSNRQMLVKLLVVALGMFGFGFALVPLYKQICEATGFRDLTRPDQVAGNTQVDSHRTITVVFDANVRSNLSWQFKPEQLQVSIHPGQLTQVMYDVKNTSGRAITGQAVPSYGPAVAGRYFRKLECFCFKQQHFEAGEARRMPVVFVVDPELPNEVNTITLSYSFFEVAGTAK
ncbi:MAG: cytochrome c oxidase assembly protein [Burkholderiales bacterium]|nr:cytochrome c oxidase assembly protein [Burkholderiales bacterium]